MRIVGKRHTHRIGPIRINRSGLRFTSVTWQIWEWRAILWERTQR